MVEPLPDDLDLDPRWTTSTRPAIVTGHKGDAGPYDSEDVEAPALDGALDFGSLRVPLPARAQLQVEGGSELLRAVHVLVPSGRVSLSALAAPRSTPLWRELSQEIGDSLSSEGARVRSEWGEWGREVQAGSNGALSRFIGVDGPRWMLYGVATGPAESAAELAVTLRRMIRETVVVRGVEPLPVKTVLPLRLPEHLEQRVEQSRRHTEDRAGLVGPSSETMYIDPEADDPLASELDWEDRYEPGSSAPDSTPRPPSDDDRFDQPKRSIGMRRAELRPVTPRSPVPRHPAAPPPRAPISTPAPAARSGPLPPVQSSDTWDTQGIPRVTADSTWTMAIPVVSSDEVQHQPAWADLAAAPSFWPEPRPSGRSDRHTGPGARSGRDHFDPRLGAPSPVESGGPPPASAGFADSGGPPPGAGDRGGPSRGGAGLPASPRVPRRASPEPDPWRPPSAEPPGPRFSEPEPRWDRPEPEEPPVDSLHDALTSDAAVTRSRPRVQRRARHRAE